MDFDQKRVLREMGRWLRVGTLTLTTLGPAIGTLITLLRQRAETASNLVAAQTDTALSQQQEGLQAIGAALSEVLSDLKKRPYSQELLKRGEELTEALVEHGSELSHTLVERGNELSHTLTERGSEISHDLIKRGEAVTHNLARRGEEVTHELKKRGNQATHEIAEQDAKFWIALGFGVGLTIAGIITFQLIRQRLRQPVDEEVLIELNYPTSSNGSTHHTPAPVTPLVTNTGTGASTTSIPQLSTVPSATATAATAAPADAVFIGVVSSKYYYPVETPLERLALPGDTAVDVIYFSTEEDAQAQGFSAAQ